MSGVAALRRRRAPAAERCDLCRTSLADDHRHLLHLEERRILCACESCYALRSGDPELLHEHWPGPERSLQAVIRLAHRTSVH